jgi:uncharacterized lipoprotein YmbA
MIRSRSLRAFGAALGYAILTIVGTGFLTACGHSPPTRFFTLDPVPPAGRGRAVYAGPRLKVIAVRLPPALDRTELISEPAPGQMEVHDFEHWAAPLGLMARQTLTLDLAERLPAGTVTGPDAPAGGGVAMLAAEILAFQTGPQGTSLQVTWSVILPSGAFRAERTVWRAPIVQLQAPAIVANGRDTARTLSLLLGQLADQIASELPAVMVSAGPQCSPNGRC